MTLKGIKYQQSSWSLVEGKQLSDEYKKINPSLSVPTLEVRSGKPFAVTQSLAALEYLEEAYPDPTPLLPPAGQLEERANVRTLCNVVCLDIQPPTNIRVLRSVKKLGGDPDQWCHDYGVLGMKAFEVIATQTAGSYSCGDQITLADVCLVPAVWNLERWKVDVAQFPTIAKVYKNLSEHAAVKDAHWLNQPDTPKHFLKKENE